MYSSLAKGQCTNKIEMLTVSAPNNRTSKCQVQKHRELQGEMDKFTSGWNFQNPFVMAEIVSRLAVSNNTWATRIHNPS
jgi:hypothetical protein